MNYELLVFFASREAWGAIEHWEQLNIENN